MRDEEINQEALGLAEQQREAWRLLWRARERLWGYARRKRLRHYFWREHSPRSYRGCGYYPLFLRDSELWYVNVGLALDRLLGGDQDALNHLHELLGQRPRKQSKALEYLRDVSACVDHEVLFYSRSRPPWYEEYDYWLRQFDFRLKRAQPWWSFHLSHYVTTSRRKVAAYDAAASRRYGWWHRVVGWWQGIKRRRRVVALADVRERLAAYLDSGVETAPDGALTVCLTGLGELDATTVGLTRTLKSVITRHWVERSLTEEERVMRKVQESPAEIPEALLQPITVGRQRVMAYLQEASVMAQSGDSLEDLQQQIIESQSAYWKRLVLESSNHARVLQIKSSITRTLAELEHPFKCLQIYCQEVRSSQATLEQVILDEMQRPRLPYVIERYELVCDWFREQEAYFALLFAGDRPEDCDTSTWSAALECIGAVYRESRDQLIEALKDYERFLVECYRYDLAQRATFKDVWSEVARLYKRGETQPLYSSSWRRAQEERFKSVLDDRLICLASAAYSEELRTLDEQAQAKRGEAMTQLRVAWCLLDDVRHWRAALADWSHRYGAVFETLRRFRLKKRISVAELTALWDDYKTISSVFRAIPHPIQMRCRCDVVPLDETDQFDTKYRNKAVDEMTFFTDDPEDPGCKEGYVGYYNSRVLMKYDACYLSPLRGVLLCDPEQKQWRLIGQDAQGKRLVSERPWKIGFKKSQAKASLKTLLSYQASSFGNPTWSEESGYALSVQLSAFLNEPGYEWRNKDVRPVMDQYGLQWLFQPLLKTLYEKEYLSVIRPLLSCYNQLKAARQFVYKNFIDQYEFAKVSHHDQGQPQKQQEPATVIEGYEAAIKHASGEQPKTWRFILRALDDREGIALEADTDLSMVLFSDPDGCKTRYLEQEREWLQKGYEAFSEVRRESAYQQFESESYYLRSFCYEVCKLLVCSILVNREEDISSWINSVLSWGGLLNQYQRLQSAYRSYQQKYHPDKREQMLAQLQLETHHERILRQRIEALYPDTIEDYVKVETLLINRSHLALYIIHDVMLALDKPAEVQRILNSMIMYNRHIRRTHAVLNIYKHANLAELMALRREKEQYRREKEQHRREKEEACRMGDAVQLKLGAYDKLCGVGLIPRHYSEFSQRYRYSPDFMQCHYHLVDAVGYYLQQPMGVAIKLGEVSLLQLMELIARPILVLVYRQEEALCLTNPEVLQSYPDILPVIIFYDEYFKYYSPIRVNDEMFDSEHALITNLLEKLGVRSTQKMAAAACSELASQVNDVTLFSTAVEVNTKKYDVDTVDCASTNSSSNDGDSGVEIVNGDRLQQTTVTQLFLGTRTKDKVNLGNAPALV